jgi:hypothetical protein
MAAISYTAVVKKEGEGTSRSAQNWTWPAKGPRGATTIRVKPITYKQFLVKYIFNNSKLLLIRLL